MSQPTCVAGKAEFRVFSGAFFIEKLPENPVIHSGDERKHAILYEF